MRITLGFIRLFIADFVNHFYDNYAIDENSPQLNYFVFITINNKNNNCPIPTKEHCLICTITSFKMLSCFVVFQQMKTI